MEKKNYREEEKMKKIRGSLRHLKMERAPAFYPLSKKKYPWAVKPNPGPHPLYRSLPLGVILRDILKYADNMREARKILGERKVKIDGRIITDYKFPVGLMDVIEILPTEEFYRVIPDTTKYLKLKEISKQDAMYKFCRIENIKFVKGKKMQLNLHDGRNILIPVNNVFDPVEKIYSTYDTLKIEIPNQQIVSYNKLEINAHAIIIDGRSVGKTGRIVEIKRIFKRALSQVTLIKNDEKISTILKYIFVLNRDEINKLYGD